MLIFPRKFNEPINNRPCAFLDRDGLININHGYVHQRQNFQLMPKVLDGLLLLKDAGYALAIVTNQSGIARGYYAEQEFQDFCHWMFDFFATHQIFLSVIAYCPHHPTAGSAAYLTSCDCRKPAPGMVNEISVHFDVDRANSVIFGDKFIDVQAGVNGNIPKQYLVTNEISERHKAQGFQSCRIYSSLYSAVQGCIAE